MSLAELIVCEVNLWTYDPSTCHTVITLPADTLIKLTLKLNIHQAFLIHDHSFPSNNKQNIKEMSLQLPLSFMLRLYRTHQTITFADEVKVKLWWSLERDTIVTNVELRPMKDHLKALCI